MMDSLASSGLICSWTRVIRKIQEYEVAHVDLKTNEASVQQARCWLHTNERRRMDQFRVDRSQREFALCRSALRYLLCHHLHCKNSHLSIDIDHRGKPYALLNENQITMHFSVSHSGNHGLIAIAEGIQVGIDLEVGSRERDYLRIAQKVFGFNECSEINSLHGLERKNHFLRIWTFKESLVKAVGTGLKTNLAKFEIPPDMRHGSSKGSIEFPADSGSQWILEDLSTNEYVAAIASEMRDGLTE